MNVDPTGTFFFGLIIGAIIAGIIAGSVNAISTAAQGGSLEECLGSFVGGFITGAFLGAATILGGGLVVGAISATVGSVIGISAFLTVGTFGAGVGAYYAENAIAGKPLNNEDALKNGAITFVQGLISFGIGAALGAGGFYDSLIPGNGLSSYISTFSQGFSSIKSVLYGFTGYIIDNAFPIFIRTIVRTPFIFPWNLIKP